MSWEADWKLGRMPSAAVLERQLDALARKAKIALPRVRRLDTGVIKLVFEVGADEAVEVVHRLGVVNRPPNDLRRDLDPPNESIDERAAEAAGLVERVTIGGRESTVFLPGYERFQRVPDHYTLEVLVVPACDDGDDDAGWPRVAVESNTRDHREGWPIAHDLGLALAERLGVHAEPDVD